MSETPDIPEGGSAPFDPSQIDTSALPADIAERVHEVVREVIEAHQAGVTWAEIGAALRAEFDGNEPLVDQNPDMTKSADPVPRTYSDWYPKAKQKLISSKVRSRGSSKADIAVFHIAAGDSTSLYSWFSSPERGVSHFYVLVDGSVEQYVPISSKSGSELNGNHHCISFETQGGSSSTKDKPWSDKQVQTMAEIISWLHADWGLSLTLAANSKSSTKGVGYHRLGIDGNFPNDPLYGGRGQRGGGEEWSTSTGKTCPENYTKPATSKSRIAQVQPIITKAGGITPPSGGGGNSSNGRIAVDGAWGNDTTRLAQEVFGTSVDGEVWNQNSKWKGQNPGLTYGWKWTTSGSSLAKGSPLIEAMQKYLNSKDKAGLSTDGLIGPSTIKALQRRLTKMGYYHGNIDGKLDLPSITIKALQNALNDGVK